MSCKNDETNNTTSNRQYEHLASRLYRLDSFCNCLLHMHSTYVHVSGVSLPVVLLVCNKQTTSGIPR